MKRTVHYSVLLVLAIGLLAAASPAMAQFDLPGPSGADENLFAPPGGEQPKNAVGVRAEFTTPVGGQSGHLFVTATIQPGWHVYSITQPAGGPIATKIEVKAPEGVRITGAFQPSVAPDKKQEPAFDNLVVESHHDIVTWYAADRTGRRHRSRQAEDRRQDLAPTLRS